jgi:hypothetical protein
MLLPIFQSVAGRLPGTFVLAVRVDEALQRFPHAPVQAEIGRLILENAKTMKIGGAAALQSERVPFAFPLL